MKPDLSKYPYFSGSIENFSLLPTQGFCNDNYSFSMDGQKYLLRKFKVEDVDRQLEYKVQNLAYEQNIAAKAILLDEEKGLMICEYLQGHHKTVLEQDDFQKLATLLKKLHSILIDTEALKLEDHFNSYTQEVKDAFQRIKNYPVENVLCHNDLNPKNILFSESIKLIDWEYAAVNDKYFDLAAVCIEFKLSEKDESFLLKHYFESDDTCYTEKLNAYKIIYSVLCKQWFEEQSLK